MNEDSKTVIQFLIDQTVQGMATYDEMEEVMMQVDSDPEVRALYMQAVAEHICFDEELLRAERIQEQRREYQERLKHAEELTAEPDRRIDPMMENDQSLDYDPY